jgi:hypothetical protein
MPPLPFVLRTLGMPAGLQIGTIAKILRDHEVPPAPSFSGRRRHYAIRDPSLASRRRGYPCIRKYARQGYMGPGSLA